MRINWRLVLIMVSIGTIINAMMFGHFPFYGWFAIGVLITTIDNVWQDLKARYLEGEYYYEDEENFLQEDGQDEEEKKYRSK